MGVHFWWLCWHHRRHIHHVIRCGGFVVAGHCLLPGQLLGHMYLTP